MGCKQQTAQVDHASPCNRAQCAKLNRARRRQKGSKWRTALLSRYFGVEITADGINRCSSLVHCSVTPIRSTPTRCIRSSSTSHRFSGVVPRGSHGPRATIVGFDAAPSVTVTAVDVIDRPLRRLGNVTAG